VCRSRTLQFRLKHTFRRCLLLPVSAPIRYYCQIWYLQYIITEGQTLAPQLLDNKSHSTHYLIIFSYTSSENKVRELIAVKVLHTSLLNTTVVTFKVHPLEIYAPIPMPSPPFKAILELVLWNGLQSCHRITLDDINVIKMPSFQYLLLICILLFCYYHILSYSLGSFFINIWL